MSSKVSWQWGSHCRRFEGRRKVKLRIYSFMYLFVKSFDLRSQPLVGEHLHIAFSAHSPGSDNPFLSSPLQPRSGNRALLLVSLGCCTTLYGFPIPARTYRDGPFIKLISNYNFFFSARTLANTLLWENYWTYSIESMYKNAHSSTVIARNWKLTKYSAVVGWLNSIIVYSNNRILHSGANEGYI